MQSNIYAYILILFNSCEPVKLVHHVILNSELVQKAFEKSCFMLHNHFDSTTNIAIDKSAISYLFQFLVQGFIRVYSKDIYQLRLSNVLLSRTGASGVRKHCWRWVWNLKKRKKSVTPENRSILNNLCPCGRNFTSKG